MTENTFYNSTKISRKSFLFLMLAVLIQIGALPKIGAAMVIQTAFEMENITSGDEKFDKEFREGRDLIDKEDWQKAAEKFNSLVEKYPNNQSTDVAFYWLAFCYKKLKMYKEADATLDRLLKNFPESSWVDDAKVMKAEMLFPLGKVYVSGSGATYSIPSAKYAVELNNSLGVGATTVGGVPYVSANPNLQGIFTGGQTKLDREDEIKIAAFQSLLSADPKKAIETLSEILTINSKASETFKLEALRVIRKPRLLSAQSNLNYYSIGIKKEFFPQIKDALMKSYQNESNLQVRKEIVYTLAYIGDDQATDFLVQLYNSESNKDLKKAIINSFGNTSGLYLGASQLFNTAAGLTIPGQNLPLEKLKKLMEITRSEKDSELRRLAFSNLQTLGGWSKNAQTLESLINLYDGESDEELKILMIRAFGAAKQTRATKKLLEIAGNGKSDKLKLEAIYALRSSNDPEAIKFLQELIK